jgi:hypothetical protein
MRTKRSSENPKKQAGSKDPPSDPGARDPKSFSIQGAAKSRTNRLGGISYRRVHDNRRAHEASADQHRVLKVRPVREIDFDVSVQPP